MKFFLTLFVAVTIPLLVWGEDGNTEAKEQIQTYRKMKDAGVENSRGYEALFNAYCLYKDIIGVSQEESEDFTESKAALKEIFYGLGDAVYFFYENDNAEKYLQMGFAYVDISLMLCMKDEHLTEDEHYFELLAFTARAAENFNDFEKAILLNEAYLNTNDKQNRLPVMQSLAMSHLALGHYDDFKSVCETALKEYPKDGFLSSKAYSVCEKQNDKKGMVLFGEYYAMFDPAMRPTQQWNKAMYLDSLQMFAEALEIWKQLETISPNDEEVCARIGFDNYNVGVLYYNKVKNMDEDDRKHTLPEAQNHFRIALPYLEDISAQTKYKTAANVATAIASCHAIIGDEKALKQDNAWLKSLGAKEVALSDTLSVETNYRPITIDPTPASPPAPVIVSDVDRDIPKLGRKNDKTYVVIFGNESYSKLDEVNVKFALNDARSFKKYCIEMLGIPEHHIQLRENATALQMNSCLRYIEEKANKNPDELRFIVYYAGHGMPDVEHDGTPYLLPCDADGSDLTGCLSLNEMYSKLEVLPTKGVTIFLDACFTGKSQDGKPLVNGRWVEYSPKKIELSKKLVVFSATSDKQRALPFNEQGHGFFTYFLLKNLKESKGMITYQQLAENLNKQVENEAKDRTNFNQTPQVNASPALGDSWKLWKLVE